MRAHHQTRRRRKKKMRSAVNTDAHRREQDGGFDDQDSTNQGSPSNSLFTNEEDQKWCCGWFAMLIVYTGVKCLQGLNFVFCTIPTTIYEQIRRCCGCGKRYGSHHYTPQHEQARLEFRSKWTQIILRGKAEFKYSNFERAELTFKYVLENVKGKDHDLEGDAYLGIANACLKMNQIENSAGAYENAALAYAAGDAFGNAEFCAQEAARVRNQDLKNNLLSQDIKMRFEAYTQRILAQQQQQQHQDGSTSSSPSSSLHRHLVQDEHHQMSNV